MSPEPSPGLHVAVVSPLPPSDLTLNEYGLHLVRALADHPRIDRVSVVSDLLPEPVPRPAPRVEVIPTWSFDDPTTALKIVRTLRDLRPDAVIWNLQFASFGSSVVAGGVGLLGPVLNRLVGRGRNQVLLHNLADEVDLVEAGLSRGPVFDAVTRLGTRALTVALLAAGRVTVTLPDYAELLGRRYRARHVTWIPHGTFDDVAAPVPEPPGHPRILAFGKFGTYKRVEPLVEACRRLRRQGRDVELVVAGTDSPNAAGYLASVEADLTDEDRVRFTGYVAEEEVLSTFADSHVVVFPYTSTTGSSGVLHQAASVGRAVALPVLGDLQRLLDDEGYVADAFEPGDPVSLAEVLSDLLDDDERRQRRGAANHRAASACSMRDVADWHVLQLLADGVRPAA